MLRFLPFARASEQSTKLSISRMEAFLGGCIHDYYAWLSPTNHYKASHAKQSSKKTDLNQIWISGRLPLLFAYSLSEHEKFTLEHVKSRMDAKDVHLFSELLEELQRDYRPFDLKVTLNISYSSPDHDDRGEEKIPLILMIKGRVGRDQNRVCRSFILWFEDISQQEYFVKKAQESYERIQQKMDFIQRAKDHIPYPLWMRDHNMDIQWCNLAYANLNQVTPSQIMATQKELSVTTPTKKNAAMTLSGRALAEDAINREDMVKSRRHVIVEGKRHLMDLFEVPLQTVGSRHRDSDTDLDQSYIGTIGGAIDVTREEELEIEKRRLSSVNRDLLENLGSAIAIFGADEKLEFYNTAYARLWHLEDSWLNNHPKLGDVLEKLREMRRLPEQSDFRQYKQEWMSYFTKVIDPEESMMHLPDGTMLRLLVIAHPMGGVITSFEDVTSRIELETSYNTLIAVQRETLDNLMEGVVVYRSDGRLQLWNPTFAEQWNLDEAWLGTKPHIGTLVEKMKPFFLEDQWTEKKQQLLAMGLQRQLEEGRIEIADGRLFDYTSVPLPDGGVLITFSDITNAARVELMLRERNSALEEAERLKLDFLANVSYQLRTPLNAIMGFSEILQNEFFGSLNERQKEYTKGIHDAGSVLLSLINDILDLSTIEAGQFSLNIESINIYNMIQNIAHLTREWAQKESLTLTLPDIPPHLPPLILQGDERRIRQAMVNLIRNAITYTPKGGDITLNAEKTDTYLIISVTDTGTGIPKDIQQRILEPFERGSRPQFEGNTPHQSGAGLGLALVNNIVKLHGGHVEIDSEVDQGTIVSLVFPIT
jgi:signal transduction histidine kinase